MSEPADVPDHHDTVVVGGGSAGSVVAARLSEDASHRVLLLESGATPHTAAGFPSELLDAGTVRGAQPDRADNWTFPALLTPDRPYATVRGRILGGSSTINGAYFIRPRRADFEHWAELGGSAWSYERALPLMIGIEDDTDFGATSALHGAQGPVGVSRGGMAHPAAHAFAVASAQLGFPEEPDKNDQAAPGFGPVPQNVVDGVRRNSGLAYVLPALDRSNLAVVGGATVTRILFSDAGDRVTGVQYVNATGAHSTYADRVVLCAGPLKTAQLLMLSGIGPGSELRRLGVPVRVDSPGIGTAFGDHPQLVIEWLPREERSAPAHRWLAAALHTAESEVLGPLKPMASLLDPAHADDTAPLPLMASVLTPRNTGRLRLESADPARPPLLDYGYLATADDRRRMRETARLCLDLLHTPAWTAAHRGLVGVGPDDWRDDASLDSWIAAHLGTALHSCGTVPFGGPDAPADGAGRVRGVDGLHVADTSLLPTAPTRGPALAAVLIGEIIARELRLAPR